MKSDLGKVLIIGSGIGGLSSAIILAGLGAEVTVLEKNRTPGGLLRSYCRDGIECPVGVHYLGSLDRGQVLRKFFDYLGVTDGIAVSRMGEGGVIDRYFFDSPSSHPAHFDMPSGFDAYERNLNKAFPEEENIIVQVMSELRRSAVEMHDLGILYAREGDFSLLEQTRPYGEILDELGCSPGLRTVLALASSWIGVPVSDCPAYYHNMALASYLSSSWRLEQSGSAMADVLVRRLEELGGRVICSAEIEKVEVDSRVVKGLHLSSGEYLAGATVIGAVHPARLLQMLPEGAVKPSYRNRIRRLQNTHSVFSVHARVDGKAHPEIPYNMFAVETDGRGDISDLRYYQLRRCERADSSLLSVLTSGNDERWDAWKESRSGQRGPAYRSKKEEFATELIREAEAFLGPFSGLQLLDCYTPLTLRDWVGSPGGSAYGVLRSSSQVLATAMLNRTAVKGLYLAGQNVLAPGIIGTIMGSFATVKLILGAHEFERQVAL